VKPLPHATKHDTRLAEARTPHIAVPVPTDELLIPLTVTADGDVRPSLRLVGAAPASRPSAGMRAGSPSSKEAVANDVSKSEAPTRVA
jgi:hypothetical protein